MGPDAHIGMLGCQGPTTPTPHALYARHGSKQSGPIGRVPKVLVLVWPDMSTSWLTVNRFFPQFEQGDWVERGEGPVGFCWSGVQ